MSEVFAKKQKFYDMLNSSDWVHSSTDSKTGLKTDTMAVANGLTACRGDGVIDFSLEQVFLTLHDDSYKKYFDPNIDEAYIISKIAANTFYTYQKSKSMLVSSQCPTLEYVVHIRFI